MMQIDGEKRGIEVLKYIENRKALKEKEFIIHRGNKLVVDNVIFSKSGKLVLYTKYVK